MWTLATVLVVFVVISMFWFGNSGVRVSELFVSVVTRKEFNHILDNIFSNVTINDFHYFGNDQYKVYTTSHSLKINGVDGFSYWQRRKFLKRLDAYIKEKDRKRLLPKIYLSLKK
jgi:hypothetical protein